MELNLLLKKQIETNNILLSETTKTLDKLVSALEELIDVNDEPKAFCVNCRVEIFAKKKSVGRPSIGVTKKVSVTLDQADWDWLGQQPTT